MNNDIEKTMAVIAGKTREGFELSQLSDVDRRQIEYALEILFSGLTLRNWMGGGKLRDAWASSVAQMRAMVFEFTEANPVVTFLRKAAFDPNAKWLNATNNSPYTNEVFMCAAGARDEYAAHADAQIAEATHIIQQKISDYIGGAPRQCVPAREPIHQVPRERERERERGERERG